MNRRSPISHFALVLCAFALFAAQAFGVQAVYYCLCGAQPVPTQASHCYGPHGEKCAGEVGLGCRSEGHRQDHQLVKQDVQFRLAEAAPQGIAPPALLAILPRFERLVAREKAPLLARASGDFEESPPFGVTVARTIVLLI